MTRFVYVLPAGRLRWEVRVTPDPIRGDIRALVDEWDEQRAAYPTATDARAVGAEAAVKLCGQELRALIDDRPVAYSNSVFYRRKAHALIAARAIAILIGGEVQPHNRWGRIQDPDSYGPDPRGRG